MGLAVLNRYPRRIYMLPIVIGALSGVEALLLWFTTSGDFCDRGDAMDMKMTGFKSVWSNLTSCVVLFNSAWILSTRREFLLALVMILVLACLTEALGFERRLIRRSRIGRPITDRDRFIDAVSFAIHVTLGYLLMLCAMTYQIEFLTAVAFGLGLGHFVFQSDDDSPQRSFRADPCCAASQDVRYSSIENAGHSSQNGLPSPTAFSSSTPLLNQV